MKNPRYLLLSALLLLATTSSFADGVGFTDGTRAGQIPANRGYRRVATASIQHVMVYLNAGEKLTVEVQRLTTTGTGVPLAVSIYSPAGIEDNFEILSTIPAATITSETYVVGTGAEGIWTVVLDGGTSVTNWRYDINALSSTDERIGGRVFTERLLTTQNTAFDFSLYHVNKLGHKFVSTFDDFNGIDAIIQTNLSGATESGSCVPIYRSREGYSPGTDCGGKFKQFFTEPDGLLPDSAARYNITAGSVYTDWIVPDVFAGAVEIDSISFQYSLNDITRPKKGVFNFDIENFDQVAAIQMDVDRNGIFTDSIDRTINFLAGATNAVAFDGLNGFGQAISCYDTLNARVLIDRGGEIHFTMEDVEGLGGLTVTRLNGLGAPNSTLYWDYRSLTERGGGYANPPLADRDGRAGVNSAVAGGVHGWPYAVNGWGNDRLIDNWAIFPTVSEERNITVNPSCLIEATDNDYSGTPVNSAASATIGNVLTNDTLYGIGNIPVAKINMSVLEAATPAYTDANVPTLNITTGVVSVPANTPSRLYTIEYQICDTASTENCSDATITVLVENEIIASDNTYISSAGDTTASILANDTLYGTVVDISKITTTPLTPVPDGFVLNPDVRVSVGDNVVSGTYTFDYQICENGATPENCDDATVTITVLNPIIALNNSYVAATGDTTTSILDNDSLNGALVDISKITTIPITPVPDGFVLNPDGSVSVGDSVISGTYTFDYKICENGATPENCDEATVDITVLNPIIANDNTYSSSPGSTTTTIFDNDSFKGAPVNLEKLTIAVISLMPTGFTLNPDGTVSVGPEVPYDTYSFDYEICETGATPPNCSEATVTIILDEPMPVHMLYFNVRKDNNSALLEWATANEPNNKGFSIERSQNGRDWTNIGFVATKAANGNSTAQLNYNYSDNKPFDGINYYRLKQQDVDGKFDYSVVKQLTFVADRIIKLYPNPAMDYVIIEGLDGTEELRLIDVSGRVLTTEKATATKAKIELNNIAAGSYQIQIISNGKLVSSHKVQKTQ